jgi:hypothetical protein
MRAMVVIASIVEEHVGELVVALEELTTLIALVKDDAEGGCSSLCYGDKAAKVQKRKAAQWQPRARSGSTTPISSPVADAAGALWKSGPTSVAVLEMRLMAAFQEFSREPVQKLYSENASAAFEADPNPAVEGVLTSKESQVKTAYYVSRTCQFITTAFLGGLVPLLEEPHHTEANATNIQAMKANMMSEQQHADVETKEGATEDAGVEAQTMVFTAEESEARASTKTELSLASPGIVKATEPGFFESLFSCGERPPPSSVHPTAGGGGEDLFPAGLGNELDRQA